MKKKDSEFYTLEQFIQIYDENNIKSNACTSYTHPVLEILINV